MTALDSRSVTVALPTLSIYFDSSVAVVQWIPLAYQLAVIRLVLSGSVVPAYTQWGDNPEVFISSFRNSWLVIAGLAAIAIATSALRGGNRRKRAGA
jgi:hypothetical protein